MNHKHDTSLERKSPTDFDGAPVASGTKTIINYITALCMVANTQSCDRYVIT